MTSVHEVKEHVNCKHVQYCLWFRDFLTVNGEDILDVTFLRDEAWFHLSRYFHSHNSDVWSAFIPHEIMETPLHDQDFCVWCMMSQIWIIGFIFFEDTIISECYCELIQLPRFPSLSLREFYLWEAMKASVYKDSPCSHHHLKEAITIFIRNIPHAELVHVFANKIKWVNTCLSACRAHF
jgi:hypothetical protein